MSSMEEPMSGCNAVLFDGKPQRRALRCGRCWLKASLTLPHAKDMSSHHGSTVVLGYNASSIPRVRAPHDGWAIHAVVVTYLVGFFGDVDMDKYIVDEIAAAEASGCVSTRPQDEKSKEITPLTLQSPVLQLWNLQN